MADSLPQSRINERNITNEMRESFLDYAMSVIVSRALPDVRDGLKPVHRRILYGLNEQGMTPDKPYIKISTYCWGRYGEISSTRRLFNL